MTSSSRFEIRCTPALRELVEALLAAEGDTTYSQLFRRLVVARAREWQTRRVVAALTKVEGGK